MNISLKNNVLAGESSLLQRRIKTVLIQMRERTAKEKSYHSVHRKKCYKQHHKLSLRTIGTEVEQAEGQPKLAISRSSSLPITFQCFDNLLKTSKASGSRATRCQKEKPSSYSPKIVFNPKRVMKHRQSTNHSENEDNIALSTPAKKLTQILFCPTIQMEEQYEKQIVKSPNIYLRTAEGKKKKTSCFMYLKKIKNKCLTHRQELEGIQGESYSSKQASTQRELYTRNNHSSRKHFYLNTFANFYKKSAKQDPKSQYSFEATYCRPWSSAKSENTD